MQDVCAGPAERITTDPITARLAKTPNKCRLKVFVAIHVSFCKDFSASSRRRVFEVGIVIE
jgi:hypothetical protein